ncbi:PP2C family protein-serine/threonine phosphatase [Kitasatospora sp. NPDC093550]|uniref:PP2C family protein-serine/threonine phosphatase n=1 Tax=Kitasatospora sp. NPDC093550 TaxID=3364089 RepID=UPI00380656C0
MTDHRRPLAPSPDGGTAYDGCEAAVVAEVLAAMPGSVVHLRPLRGPGGQVEDFVLAAVSPETVDIGGRRGPELIGRSILRTYPGFAGTDLWRAYLDVLSGADPYTGEIDYEERTAGIPHRSRYRVRVAACRGGLIVSFTRLDSGERERHRLALMQSLGRMGWVDRDLVRGRITWSDEVYSIFGRDPAQGPVPLEELATHAQDDDRPLMEQAVRGLLKAGEPLDHTFRIRLPGQQLRHVRIVAETENDADGHPVQVHGLFHDLSAVRDAEQQLLEHKRSVLAQQSQLAAERDLAARLQETLLPVPQQQLTLAGLTVDVAYLPVQEGLKLGGDWYSAVELPDGNALLVVGDVAGHGLDAVATMALLRFTAKGMAITGTPLPEILASLNTLILHSSERQFHTATMIMAVYEPTTSRLTWVRAGHPPPLLLRDGRPRFLPAPEGMLLGAVPGPSFELSTLELLPGDHLLLYTDGLIEHPGESLDQGMDRLATATRAADPGRPRFLDRLIPALVTPDDRRDDICALHLSSPAGTPG